MPLTKTGKKVMKSMKKTYGNDAEKVFYATINSKKNKTKKWHKKRGKM